MLFGRHVGSTAPIRALRHSTRPWLGSVGTALALSSLLVACGGKAVIDGVAPGEDSSVQVVHGKVEGSGSGGGMPCGFCTSPSTLLEVDYLIDGQESVTATGSGSLYCMK